MRRLRVLSVAYPFAPAGPDAVGGAEQVLSMIERGLVARGHRSVVVACAGSRVAGELVPVPAVAGPIDEAARSGTHAAVRAAIADASEAADVVHLHGIDFAAYAPTATAPVLATLHLPPDWYGPATFSPPPGRWLHCVSAAQHAACPPCPALLPPIANGVDVASLRRGATPRQAYALVLGRLCPEKGQHLALRAAHAAGVELVLAGCVFRYPAHEDYVAREVAPLLDARRRWVGPVGFEDKRALLGGARCLLVPSLAAETSSLVAMEAAACGTPVVAFRAGALPDIVRHGETGFLVDDAAGMAEAIGRVGEISPDRCRAEAQDRFDAGRMVDAYIARYRALAA